MPEPRDTSSAANQQDWRCIVCGSFDLEYERQVTKRSAIVGTRQSGQPALEYMGQAEYEVGYWWCNDCVSDTQIVRADNWTGPKDEEDAWQWQASKAAK